MGDLPNDVRTCYINSGDKENVLLEKLYKFIDLAQDNQYSQQTTPRINSEEYF